MNARILYHKRTGEPVQIIAWAQTKPTFQDVICYQELTEPFDYYVMEKRQFFAEYVKEFIPIPLKDRKEIGVREDLPDNQRTDEIIVEETTIEEPMGETDSRMEKILAFLDADTYRDKIRILEKMKDDLDEHVLNNLAVSLDLSIEVGVDGYERILSELQIRSKYEDTRGEKI